MSRYKTEGAPFFSVVGLLTNSNSISIVHCHHTKPADRTQTTEKFPQQITMTIALPQLPLVCLKTADLKDTEEVVRGKNTVIGKFCPFKMSFFRADNRLTNLTLGFVFLFRLLDDKMHEVSRCLG